MIRRYVLLLVGIILALSLSPTIYLYLSHSRLNAQVAIINQFHLTSAKICDRISEELQSIRAHHAEEHLSQIVSYQPRKTTLYHKDHFRTIQAQFNQLTTLWQQYREASASYPELLHYYEDARRWLWQLDPIWLAEDQYELIDPLFEASVEALQALSADMMALERGHVRMVDKMGEQLTQERQWHERVLYLLTLLLAIIGLFAGKKIMQLIVAQINQRIVTEHKLSKNLVEIQKSQLERDMLRRSNRAMIIALADLAENRDNNTGEHVLRVARLTHEIALELRAMGVTAVDDPFLAQIASSSMLHDVGKVSTPDHILLKPGALSAEERIIMQQHAQAGGHFLEKIASLQEMGHHLNMAGRIARFHHEQYQGGGYPDGLVGEDIPLEARIVTVADVYDALTSWRPYKKPWTQEQANDFIRERAGKLFDPNVVQAFFAAQARREEVTALQWQEEMTVGIAVLDNDHRKIISLINQMTRCQQQPDTTMIELVLDELYNYTTRHLQREEAFLREIGFPSASDHTQSHNQFAQQVAAMRRRYFHEQRIEIAEGLTALMTRWLIEHILREDQLYARWYAEIGQPAVQCLQAT
ncbi:MAG: bacteriohemerythrin [Magnetococcales bacterium]|nr:bacteriohemerythrin [Magnetococcales bacterium]